MRWFDEAVWYPTALLPNQGVTWSAEGATSARATMTDRPLTFTLLVRFGADGMVASVHADARAATLDGVAVMLPWECRISDCRTQGGMVVPMTGEVLEVAGQGEAVYFRGALDAVADGFGA
jgi:hypothetical protein